MSNPKLVNNPTDLRNTHSSSAKNCFQAGPRSLYGVNYLLMRDVLVTFMYVLLAGGRLRALLGDADSPALFVHHHGTAPRHGTRTIHGTARFFDPTRLSRPRRRMPRARTARAHFERNSAQTTSLAGFEGSEGCFRVLAVEVRRGLSRILLTEKLRSFLQEKWRRGSRCRGHFMDITLGDCYAWKTGVEPLFVTNILQSLFLTGDLGSIVYIIY